MTSSTDHIATSHVGSLPRTPELIAANAARKQAADGLKLSTTVEFDTLLQDAVVNVVARQKDLGITIPNDGDFGKATSSDVDYGPWWTYSFNRTAGLELVTFGSEDVPEFESSPGKVQLNAFSLRREFIEFSDAYTSPTHGLAMGEGDHDYPVCVGPISYIGQDAVARDIRNLRAGLDASGFENGFLTAVSPGAASDLVNRHYDTREELIWAWADVLREEYKAITDSGLILQIDDPSIAANWDQITPEPTVEDYLDFTRTSVEALNYALRGLPEEQIRFHLCWGSWHGPHTSDLELKNLIGTLLSINAGSYSFEAANVRHEHEWQVWKDVTLPEGKKIIPGIVSHATNVVEHPELIADRIERFASVVGRENVVASTDCGLGGRVHPQIAEAKLRSLAAGADIASKRLWRS